MPNTILLKRSQVPGVTPNAANMTLGELAINISDMKLFTKKLDGTVGVLGGGGVTEMSQLGGTGFSAGDIPQWNGSGWTVASVIDGGTP